MVSSCPFPLLFHSDLSEQELSRKRPQTYADIVTLFWSVQGSRSDGPRALLDDHALHAMADGGDARDGGEQALRPLPRAGPGGVRREARVMGGGAAAIDRRSRRRHRVHGHGWYIVAGLLPDCLQRSLPFV